MDSFIVGLLPLEPVNMAFNTDWNVEKYKCEHESDEHWQLRKRFIETHKNNYPEDKLVCLARVFFNVEFLGCRYPEKTMRLIEDLSREVAAEHREKQKNKLKRTFVQASDAAEAKAKRSTVEPPNKVTKTSTDAPQTNFEYSCFVHADLVKPDPIVDTGDFPGFIIYENCNSLGQIEACPINILTMSSSKNKQWNSIDFDFPAEKNKPNQAERVCEIKLNNKVLSSGTGGTIKEARMKAAIEGLNILRKTCYTIQAKRAFFSESPSISKDGAAKETESRLPQDNVGSRMMQKMGWTGSGLGKKQQGIQDPIKAAPQIMQRSGLGRINEREFQERFRKVFKDYIASDSDSDLVFAPDFSSAERKVLHHLAQQLQLKTRSYGKDNQRHLVVYKILALPMILEILLKCGGENEKYVLMPPTEASNTQRDAGQTSSGIMFEAPDSDCPDSKIDETNKPEEIENNTPSLSITDSSEQQPHVTNEIADPENKEDADDIALFDEVLKEREINLRALHTRFETLNNSFAQTQAFASNKEAHRFKIYRNEIAGSTGEWLAGDILPEKEKKKDKQLRRGRAINLGLELVLSNGHLKQTIIDKIKNRSVWKKISLNMSRGIKVPAKLVNSVDFELERLGKKCLIETNKPNLLFSDIKKKRKILNQYSKREMAIKKPTDLVPFSTIKEERKKLNTLLKEGMANTQKEDKGSSVCSGTIEKEKITLNPPPTKKKAKKYSIRKRSKQIKFVKETNLDVSDDGSGMEYSDEFDISEDSNSNAIELNPDLNPEERHYSNQNVNLIDKNVTTVETKPTKSENIIGLRQEILDNNNVRVINTETDEVSDFFQAISKVAKSFSPTKFQKLKNDITDVVEKALVEH